MRNSLGVSLGLLLVLAAVPVFSAVDGPALFKTKCAACHGVDGTGQTAVGKNLKIRDFHAAEVQSATDAQLTKIIEEGKGKMPALKGKLTNDELASLVKHIRSFKK